MIQFVKDNNDIKVKLIKKLKEKACRAVKKVMMAKGTDREDELNNDDNLKNLTPTSKDSKDKLRFTKSVILTQTFLCI